MGQPWGFYQNLSQVATEPRRVTSDVLKTRYIMCWVNTFMVVLSTTSYTAPRGAQWDSPGSKTEISFNSINFV